MLLSKARERDFVGNTVPAEMTQSDIFSSRPQRQRCQTARYTDGSDDTEIAGNAENDNPDHSADFSDQQNLRALRASLTVAIYKIDECVSGLFVSFVVERGISRDGSYS